MWPLLLINFCLHHYATIHFFLFVNYTLAVVFFFFLHILRAKIQCISCGLRYATLSSHYTI